MPGNFGKFFAFLSFLSVIRVQLTRIQGIRIFLTKIFNKMFNKKLRSKPDENDVIIFYHE